MQSLPLIENIKGYPEKGNIEYEQKKTLPPL